MFIVYTKIIKKKTIEHWFYGTYNDETKANCIALELGHNCYEGIYHCVCNSDEIDSLNIQNVPQYAKKV